MEFACSVCDYRSPQKISVVRHINRKKSCGHGTKWIIEVPIEIICEYCDKIFTSIPNLKKHQKSYCKHKDKFFKKELENLTKENKKLVAENKKLIAENNKLEKELDELYEELRTEDSESPEESPEESSAETDKYILLRERLEMSMRQEPSPKEPSSEEPVLSSEEQEGENRYIYLIQIYPYSDQIFKIGRTGDLPKRLAQYKRYKVVYATSCKDDAKCERDLVKLLKAKTIQCKELGNEYFKGTYAQMKKIVKDYFISM
jgi:regulator of replication initiation timing